MNTHWMAVSTRTRWIALILLTTTTFSTLLARQIQLWPYDRLKSASSLVIVAVPDSSKESGEVVHGQLWNMDFIGVNTTLKVKGVIKGRYRADTITVFHLKMPENATAINGPYMAHFHTEPVEQLVPGGGKRLANPEYLIFLKKRKDGRYEPVSGPMDSGHSIRQLQLSVGP